MAEPAAGTDSPTEIAATFELTGWDEHTYDEPGDGPKLTRVTVRKTFSGALEGSSVAELLTAQGEHGRGYVASERFVGAINGRSGTVVFQHGGLDDGHEPFSFGGIVPGSGTSELAGITGAITYTHDESGARVTLVLEH